MRYVFCFLLINTIATAAFANDKNSKDQDCNRAMFGDQAASVIGNLLRNAATKHLSKGQVRDQRIVVTDSGAVTKYSVDNIECFFKKEGDTALCYACAGAAEHSSP